MAHDVFISYSSHDKAVADAVCAGLECRRVRCWIAPRDVLPGVPYAEALIDGLNQSRLMVLVFSNNSNTSPQVVREVERAVNKGIAILPFRIENVVPSKAMEYFVSSSHWLDALTPPLEMHLQRLADTVQVLLAGGNTSLADTLPFQPSSPAAKGKSGNKVPLLLIVGGIVVVLVIGGAVALNLGFGRGFLSRFMAPNAASSAPPTSSASKAPSPQVKSPAAPLSGQTAKGLLYEDNFDDPSSGWKKISDDTRDSNYASGEYSLTVKKWNWGDWMVNRNAGRFADMVLDIDARLVSGSFQSSYGVVFRVQNDDSFYRVLVSGQGEYAIQKRAGGVVHVLQKYTKSPFINQGNAANHLKVMCKGTHIDVSCNGHPLASITDESFSEGFAGVAVFSVEPPATANFDNLMIYGGN